MEQTIRGISLWQPWATAFCRPEIKLCETRSWNTNYSGPLLIQATASIPPAARQLYESDPYGKWSAAFPEGLNSLPVGGIIGIVNLKETFDTAIPRLLELQTLSKDRQLMEFNFGDWTPGRFAWYAPDKLLFDEPIPYKGTQGFWNYRINLLPGNAQEFIKKHRKTKIQ